MTKHSVIFAKWDSICFDTIHAFKDELNLPDGFIDHYFEQFKNLESQQHNQEIQIEKLRSRNFEDNRKSTVIEGNISEEDFLKFKLTNPVDNNQFATISNSRATDFLWVDDRIEDVLDIDKKNWSILGLCSIDVKLNLFHPMDVLHFLRYGTIIHLVTSLKGLAFNSLKDYYSVTFKLGQDITVGEKFNKSTKLVERKSYPIANPESFIEEQKIESNSSSHLDIWTVSDYHEKNSYVRTRLEIIDNPVKNKFMNLLFYISNAKFLGFYPKELIVLSYLDTYDTPEESRSSLNREIRLQNCSECQFENKAFTDFSYLLNKKLSKSLTKYSLGSENNSQYFNRLNRLNKAKKLGLLPLPDFIEEIIIKSISPIKKISK
ncbi:MAG: hypothetical protein ACI8XB_002706 [Patiriisocius sp.]|jgi:hypothetical protein